MLKQKFVQFEKEITENIEKRENIFSTIENMMGQQSEEGKSNLSDPACANV